MRLLIIAERYHPQRGGLARSSRRIAGGLAARGIEIHVITNDYNVSAGDMASRDEGGVIVHRLGKFPEEYRADMVMGRAVEMLHARHPYDALIGMYLVKAGYIAALEAKLLGRPSLLMARGNDVDREIFVSTSHPFVMSALNMATAVGCVSRELVAKCRALSNRDNIHYTPNSVDYSVFTPGNADDELRKSLGLGDLVIGFSGELRFKKGMHHLLAVAEYLAPDHTGFKFLIIGGTRRDDEAEFRALLDESPILKDIIVETPYVDDPAELIRYYRLMDVLFMPSFWEGMPNSCLEAFACGIPVVGSTAGALRELIQPGITGYSFAPGDFHGAVESLKASLSLPAHRRREMGSLAREMVQRDYTPELEIDRIMEIINGIV